MEKWQNLKKISFSFALVVLLNVTGTAESRAQDPAVYYIAGAALTTVLPGFIFDLPQPDSKQAFTKLSASQFDAVDDENKAYDFSLEFQPGWTWARIKPLVGVTGNTDGSFYGWLAASHDFHITRHFVINFNIGPAFYIGGDKAKNLGSAGVLRSGFEIGYRFDNAMRITGSFHHMSHGKLLNPDTNPGTEMIGVNLNVPIN